MALSYNRKINKSLKDASQFEEIPEDSFVQVAKTHTDKHSWQIDNLVKMNFPDMHLGYTLKADTTDGEKETFSVEGPGGSKHGPH